MNHKTYLSTLIILLFLLSAQFMLPAQPASAQRIPTRPVCPEQQITNNTGSDNEPKIENGKIIWEGYDGNDREIYFWNGFTTLQLTNNDTNDRFPQFSGGLAVWEGYAGADTEIFLWDGVSTTQLTDNTSLDWSPQIDNGMVTWYGHDGTDWEIYLWNGISTIQITNNDVDDWEPLIDNGMIVWERFDGLDWEIFLWDGIAITQLTNNAVDDMMPQIDDGIVVWRGDDGADFDIFAWDGVSTTNISNNTIDDSQPQINLGQVVWQGLDGADWDIFYWNGATTLQLTANAVADTVPRINRGQVVWQSDDTTDSEVYLWDSVTTNQLTNDSYNDRTPMIDNGHIVWWGPDGTDNEIYYARCDYRTYPLDLMVSGDLTTAPALPTLHWTHQATIDQINAGPQFRIVLMEDTSIALDHTVEADDFCLGTVCTLPLADIYPRWGLPGGDYQWWVGAVAADGITSWSGGNTYDPALFSVTIPDAALPDPITVNPADGRIGITFPDDPGTLWVQVWIGPHPNGNYFEWHERNGADKKFTCDGTNCVIYPKWDAPTATGLSVWMQAWGPNGFSSGGTAAPTAPSWNVNVQPFDLPAAPATLPSNIAVAGTSGEPGFTWTGGANATWYNLVIRKAGTSTQVYSDWYQASVANCPGALANPPDYECSALWLYLSYILTVNSSYDVFISAWGPGGFSEGSGIPGMDQYAQGGPFTYSP